MTHGHFLSYASILEAREVLSVTAHFNRGHFLFTSFEGIGIWSINGQSVHYCFDILQNSLKSKKYSLHTWKAKKKILHLTLHCSNFAKNDCHTSPLCLTSAIILSLLLHASVAEAKIQ